jgi:peptidoglycan/LPS O-acetylase OafA/YrhL
MQNPLFSFVNTQAYSVLPTSDLTSAESPDESTQFSSPRLSAQLRGFLWILLPTWMQQIFQKSNQSKTQPIHPTLWLDGLRGYAALTVTLMHYSFREQWWANPYSFGSLEADDDPLRWRSFLQLPIVRLWESGSFSVTIFMVISGYVLSFRKVTLIREGNIEKLAHTMCSSIVRRPFRLFLPMAGGLFLMQLGESLGLYSRLMSEWPSMEDWESVTPLQAWVNLVKRILHIADAVYYIDSDGLISQGFLQFWTIPNEFTASLILFIIIIAVCRMSYKSRVLVVLTIAANSFYSGRWATGLFLTGYLIAETEANRSSPHSSRLETIFWSSMFVLSLVFGSYPYANVKRDALLWWTDPLTPESYGVSLSRAYPSLALGSTLLLKSVFRVPKLQGIFTTKFGRYLGDLSYSIYAVQYIVQFILRPSLTSLAVSIFGEMNTNFRRDMGMILQLIIVTFFTIWLADLFRRCVDEPSIRVAKWVEMSLRSSEPKQSLEIKTSGSHEAGTELRNLNN